MAQPKSTGAPVEIGQRHRNLQLDVLRGVAILMVLWCHTFMFRKAGWDAAMVGGGWAGVDLFFVLSGFLISGLLFAEYKKTGGVRFRRFAVRRALKLYPAFYALVLLTVAARLASHREAAALVLRGFLSDVFFFQSYSPGTYVHFWSLSVEEHFYILLPVTLYFLMRRRRTGDSDPFRFLPWLFALVAVLELGLRLWNGYHVPFNQQSHLERSHLRMDSLLFGVLLSYWSNFHGKRFWSFARAAYPLLFAAGALLVAPIFFLDHLDRWMYTYGFTLLYLGFGALLVAMLSLNVEAAPQAVRWGFRIVAYIGTFSYSIYLWHLAWLHALMHSNITALPYAGVAAYFVGAIAVGIVTSKLVEMPVLRLRERLFPSAAATPERVSAAKAVGVADAA